MKAITLHQPWATLVANGTKWIETRSWSTRYRGPLAVHAAKRRPDVEMLEDGPAGDEPWGLWYETPKDDWRPVDPPPELRWTLAMAPSYMPESMPLGYVVATCRLADVLPIRDPMDHDTSGDYLIVGPGVGLGFRDGRPFGMLDQCPYGDYAPGRYAWLLEDVTPIEPVPMKGKQGLWEW